MFKPVAVKALSGFRLWLRYADGVEGGVDLSHLAGRGVFRIWTDQGVFETVRIGEDGGIRHQPPHFHARYGEDEPLINQ